MMKAFLRGHQSTPELVKQTTVGSRLAGSPPEGGVAVISLMGEARH